MDAFSQTNIGCQLLSDLLSCKPEDMNLGTVLENFHRGLCIDNNIEQKKGKTADVKVEPGTSVKIEKKDWDYIGFSHPSSQAQAVLAVPEVSPVSEINFLCIICHLHRF